MDIMELIYEYRGKFDEGPPIYGMEENEAIKKMQYAIDNNKKIEEGAEADIPPGAMI
jgi:hypothetical protein